MNSSRRKAVPGIPNNRQVKMVVRASKQDGSTDPQRVAEVVEVRLDPVCTNVRGIFVLLGGIYRG